MYILKYSALLHMAETHELRASPPYEGVPNISQFRFNNQYSMDVFFVFIYDPASFYPDH